jgi:hypothetical protein
MCRHSDTKQATCRYKQLCYEKVYLEVGWKEGTPHRGGEEDEELVVSDLNHLVLQCESECTPAEAGIGLVQVLGIARQLRQLELLQTIHLYSPVV